MANNVEMLHDTLQIFDQGYYLYDGSKVPCRLTLQQRMQAHVYLPEDVAKVRQNHPNTGVPFSWSVHNMDSFQAARNRIDFNRSVPGPLKRVLVLNLANPIHPGGSVHQGGRAQEEDLCRKSSLLYSLSSQLAAAYYRYHRNLNSPMASDAMILSPRVEIIRDEQGRLLEKSEIVSVLSCSAPDLRTGLGEMTQQQYEQLLYRRIVGMLCCASLWGYESLILGAFGCGVFANDAEVVARLFRKALQCHGNSFFTVEFAVLDKSIHQYNFDQFANHIKGSTY